MGVTYKEATNALLLHQNDLVAACNCIHDKLLDAVNKYPYHSHLNLWVPRVALRISEWVSDNKIQYTICINPFLVVCCSWVRVIFISQRYKWFTLLNYQSLQEGWLPNLQSDDSKTSPQISSSKDYFTGYVLTVNFTDTNDSMHSWRLTYRYQCFRSLSDIVRKHGSHVPVNAPFPYATAMQSLFGNNKLCLNIVFSCELTIELIMIILYLLILFSWLCRRYTRVWNIEWNLNWDFSGGNSETKYSH